MRAICKKCGDGDNMRWDAEGQFWYCTCSDTPSLPAAEGGMPMTPPTERQLVTAEMARQAWLATEGVPWVGSEYMQSLADALNAALRPVIEGEIARARLEEAKWWQKRHSIHYGPNADYSKCGCESCQRVAELSREAGQ